MTLRSAKVRLALTPQTIPNQTPYLNVDANLQRRWEQRFKTYEGLNLIDFAAELYDFAETAAVMANLDLVIGVDTATLHMAGALGRPTWAMVTYSPDWRWMLDRADSPWYPTMRLFRQPEPGNWHPVVDTLAIALREMAQAHRP